MDDAADTAQVIIRPPLAWGLAVIAGLALDWLVALPFLPAGLAAGWLGVCLSRHITCGNCGRSGSAPQKIVALVTPVTGPFSGERANLAGKDKHGSNHDA